jgi:hypothetical protein
LLIEAFELCPLRCGCDPIREGDRQQMAAAHTIRSFCRLFCHYSQVRGIMPIIGLARSAFGLTI